MKIFDYLVTGSLLMIVAAIFYLPVYFILRKKKIPILKQLSWVLLGGVIGCMTYEIIVRLFLTKHEFESKEFEIKTTRQTGGFH